MLTAKHYQTESLQILKFEPVEPEHAALLDRILAQLPGAEAEHLPGHGSEGKGNHMFHVNREPGRCIVFSQTWDQATIEQIDSLLSPLLGDGWHPKAIRLTGLTIAPSRDDKPAYVQKTVETGDMIRVSKYPRRAGTRAAKSGFSSEKKNRDNQRQCVQKLTDLINTNFDATGYEKRSPTAGI